MRWIKRIHTRRCSSYVLRWRHASLVKSGKSGKSDCVCSWWRLEICRVSYAVKSKRLWWSYGGGEQGLSSVNVGTCRWAQAGGKWVTSEDKGEVETCSEEKRGLI
jgi:hypothetical protein